MARSSEAVIQQEENEIVEVLVTINRVAKVVKGGRRFGFAAVVVVGDKKGRVGYGLGKAKEVMEAKSKAAQAAKKNMMRVYLREGRTIHHDVVGHFGSGKVILRSARPGTGVIAGGPMRAVFESLGLSDIVAKSVGSSNVHNMIRATFDALSNLSSPRYIADRRSMKIGEVVERRDSFAKKGVLTDE
jgi:small subunit ribosomal protein S5